MSSPRDLFERATMQPISAADRPQTLDIAAIRSQFPALDRRVNGRPAVFFDGPAGSQTPRCVPQAMSDYLLGRNANHGGVFATSRESDALLDEAHRAIADLLGGDDPGEVAFGANMTTLTMALSRALGKTWQTGDEIVVTEMDHDANVTPWVLAARDAGAVVKRIKLRHDDCTLDLGSLNAALSNRTRLVAVTCASNAVGTINPLAEIVRVAHAADALVFLDAVHYAPHGLIDVAAWGCDFLACSAYKFFGPHVGVLWGRRELLERTVPYKLRPAPDDLPGRWMTGTQNHEGIAGVLAAVNWLADAQVAGADSADGSRRERIAARFALIVAYERQLAARFLAGLRSLSQWRLFGIGDAARLAERTPTFAIRHARRSAEEAAQMLAERGLFTWHGNFYALPLTEALGLEPEGLLRIGFLHYNTAAEVDRLLAELAEIA
jgi:cysteine desulfurase family protein (TIGR01976 family)